MRAEIASPAAVIASAKRVTWSDVKRSCGTQMPTEPMTASREWMGAATALAQRLRSPALIA